MVAAALGSVATGGCDPTGDREVDAAADAELDVAELTPDSDAIVRLDGAVDFEGPDGLQDSDSEPGAEVDGLSVAEVDTGEMAELGSDTSDGAPDAAASDLVAEIDDGGVGIEVATADIGEGDGPEPDADSTPTPDSDDAPDASDLELAPDESEVVGDVPSDVPSEIDAADSVANDTADGAPGPDSLPADVAMGEVPDVATDLQDEDVAADAGDAIDDGQDVADTAADAHDVAADQDAVQSDAPELEDTSDDLAADSTGDHGPDVEPLCAPADCDDGDPCTVDWCDAVDGCAHSVDTGAPCDDSDKCSAADACDSDGVCMGSAVVCEDSGEPCLSATCDDETGECGVPVVDGTSCDDGDACNGSELCMGGVCNAGAVISLDDSDPCTQDTCDPRAWRSSHPGRRG